MDALGLINLALMRIGERAIADVAADSTTARVASQFFRHSVDEVTTENQWTFAKKRAQLTYIDPESQGAPTNLSGYEFMYNVPADALRILSMVEDEQFIIESGLIYSNAENPTIVYLATLVTEGDTGAGEDKFTIPGGLPPKFLEATACRLGMKIGTKIGADGQIMGMLAQEYRFLLQQAMNNDAMDSPGKEDDQVAWWYEG